MNEEQRNLELKLEVIQQRNNELEDILRQQKYEIHALKRSTSYRFGSAIFHNLSSPKLWPRIPLDVAKALVQRHPAPAIDKPKHSTNESAKRAREQLKHATKAVRQAYTQAVDTNDWAAGYKSLSQSEIESHRRIAHLFKAVAEVEDEASWALNVNTYLAYFGLSPVSVSKGNTPLFYRLKGEASPKMDSPVKISVIMPAHNAEDTIELAVGSILNQTWTNLELLVINDCSTDSTAKILADLAKNDQRLRVFDNPVNVGPYVSKNIGVSKSTGTYITGHDADDWAHPQRLEKQITFLQTFPDRKATLSHMLRMDEKGFFEQFMEIGSFSFDGAARVASISAMFEKQFFLDHLGAWDGAKFGADSELIHRMETLYPDLIDRQHSISMFCLSSENNLTNHAQYGIRAGGGQMSPARLDYKQTWTHWHDQLTPEQSRLPFPHRDRAFPMPAEMSVDVDKIEKVITHHKG